ARALSGVGAAERGDGFFARFHHPAPPHAGARAAGGHARSAAPRARVPTQSLDAADCGGRPQNRAAKHHGAGDGGERQNRQQRLFLPGAATHRQLHLR
nr:hypothetical protein [Tanacetum cinerariifolium]